MIPITVLPPPRYQPAAHTQLPANLTHAHSSFPFPVPPPLPGQSRPSMFLFQAQDPPSIHPRSNRCRNRHACLLEACGPQPPGYPGARLAAMEPCPPTCRLTNTAARHDRGSWEGDAGPPAVTGGWRARSDVSIRRRMLHAGGRWEGDCGGRFPPRRRHDARSRAARNRIVSCRSQSKSAFLLLRLGNSTVRRYNTKE